MTGILERKTDKKEKMKESRNKGMENIGQKETGNGAVIVVVS